jgi:hypothetical protein
MISAGAMCGCAGHAKVFCRLMFGVLVLAIDHVIPDPAGTATTIKSNNG